MMQNGMLGNNMLQPIAMNPMGGMPGYPTPQIAEQGPLLGAQNLFVAEKVAIVNDNTFFEKILQCCCPLLTTCFCPRRFKVSTLENGYDVTENTLFKMTETRCCCPNRWRLTNSQEQEVANFNQKCCWFHPWTMCFGGPGFDVQDMSDNTLGDANHPPCQCCDGGYDITQNDMRKFFVGHVCMCCDKGLYPTPVWNGDKNEIETINIHVIPCIKRWLPLCCCCLNSYHVIYFPNKANQVDRAAMVAGGLMQSR